MDRTTLSGGPGASGADAWTRDASTVSGPHGRAIADLL